MSTPTPERKKAHELKRTKHRKSFKDASPEELRFRRWAITKRIAKAKKKEGK